MGALIFMENKGYTLLEVIISIFLLSIIFLASAMAIKALGITTKTGIDDITYRRNINKVAEDMNNIVSSLLSVQDESYSWFTNAGLVVNISEEPQPNENNEKIYRATDITLYVVGNKFQKRDLRIISDPDIAQENKMFSNYGLLAISDSVLNKEKYDKREIAWEEFVVHDPIKISTEQFMSGKAEKTEFVITTVNDMLKSIKITILIPTEKGYNRKFDLVFTCHQEVRVSAK